MSALKHAQELRSCTSFLAIGRDYENTLHPTYWENLLDAVCSGIDDPTTVPAACSPAAAATVLKHFHCIHLEASYRHVLSTERWNRWWNTLASFRATPDAVSALTAANFAVEDYALSELERVRLTCMKEFNVRSHAARCFTSDNHLRQLQKLSAALSSASTSSQMFSDEGLDGKNGNDADASEQDGETADVNAAIRRLCRRYRAPITLSRYLELTGRHLLAYCNLAGELERSWLSELSLVEGTEPAYDTAVECLQRRSFKRDLSTPSLAAESIWTEYEEFEVDDDKKKKMKKIAERTKTSPACRAAEEWFKCAFDQTGTGTDEAHVQFPSTFSTHIPLRAYTEKEGKLLDNCVNALRQEKGVSLTPYAISMYRLLERESPPGGLNPSRLEFYLSLLSRWFTNYVRTTESLQSRPEEAMFDAEESELAAGDSTNNSASVDGPPSLWRFVLDQHQTLLLHALHHLYTASLDAAPHAFSIPDANRHLRVVHCLKTIVLSLANFRDIYVNALRAHSHRRALNESVMTARISSVSAMTNEMLDTWLLGTIFPAVYADTPGADDDDSSSQHDGEPPTSNNNSDAAADALTLEAELRLVMCLAQTVLRTDSVGRVPARDLDPPVVVWIKKRVCALVDAIFAYLERSACDTLAAQLLCSTQLRLISHISDHVPVTSVSASTAEVLEACYYAIAAHKRLLKLLQAKIGNQLSCALLYDTLYPLISDSWTRAVTSTQVYERGLSASDHSRKNREEGRPREQVVPELYCEVRRAAKLSHMCLQSAQDESASALVTPPSKRQRNE